MLVSPIIVGTNNGKRLVGLASEIERGATRELFFPKGAKHSDLDSVVCLLIQHSKKNNESLLESLAALKEIFERSDNATKKRLVDGLRSVNNLESKEEREKGIYLSDHEITLHDGKTIKLSLLSIPSIEPLTPGTKASIKGLYASGELRNGMEKQEAIDLGTGSGAIAIVLAKGNRFSKVYAFDKNSDLQDLVRINSIINNVEEKVIFLETNLFDPLKRVDYSDTQLWAYNKFSSSSNNKKVDLIISNPPQRPSLPGTTETKLQLFKYGSQKDYYDDGLDFTQQILLKGSSMLNKNGRLYLQMLAWHNGRFQKIASGYNLHQVPNSSVRKLYSPGERFPFPVFVKAQTVLDKEFIFLNEHSSIISAVDAQEYQEEGTNVLTEFALYRLAA